MEKGFKQIRGHTFLDRLSEQPLVVDLGANVGRFAGELLESYPAAQIVLVEGDPYLLDILRRRFARSPNVRIFQGLVGPRSIPRTPFHLSKVPEGNSVLRQFSETWGPGESREIQVEMISLADLFRLLEARQVDLLKVDIEGSEWELLEQFSPELAAVVDQLTVEFHDFLAPGLRARTERCIQHLEQLGYRAGCRSTDHVHGSPYFDCLFVRR
jgi:FkbM family methyltransferase